MMPEPGDKLYRCFDGALEEGIFVAEGIAPGAVIPTYIMCRDISNEDSFFRCPKDMYTDKRTALEKWLKEVTEAIPRTEGRIADAEAHLVWLHSEVERIKQVISEVD